MRELRADFARREVVHTDELAWERSPSPQVWRKRIELWGPIEAGRVTSVVKYEPGSVFPRHAHPEGEEILVLDGVFSDEHGNYPRGTFLLNPDGSTHAPFSDEGCTLFVKLRQSPGPRVRRCVAASELPWRDEGIPGVESLELFSDPAFPEQIGLTRLAPGVSVGPMTFPDGEEILVLQGSFEDEHGTYRTGSWLRFPPGASHTLSTPGGCTLYVKHGHLAGLSPAARAQRAT